MRAWESSSEIPHQLCVVQLLHVRGVDAVLGQDVQGGEGHGHLVVLVVLLLVVVLVVKEEEEDSAGIGLVGWLVGGGLVGWLGFGV